MRIALAACPAALQNTVRRMIRTICGHEVIWIADNGAEAVAQCRNMIPDLLLMKLDMPEMGGVEATRQIMARTPCPILLLACTPEDTVTGIFKAMGLGAVDVLHLPSLDNPANPVPETEGLNLCRKLKTAACLTAEKNHKILSVSRPSLVAIGASTGGPRALADILSVMPPDFGGTILIVQHMEKTFSREFIDWLDTRTPLPVKQAEPDESPQAGTVYVADTGVHLVLKPDFTFACIPEPGGQSYCPSVDVLFRSLADLTRKGYVMAGGAVGVLLSGMGRDGAEGLLALRESGWHTIVQDMESSVVYGMPKAAARLGAAREILPLDRIGQAILARTWVKPRRCFPKKMLPL